MYIHTSIDIYIYIYRYRYINIDIGILGDPGLLKPLSPKVYDYVPTSRFLGSLQALHRGDWG